jgi:putative endonuclease
VQRNYRGLGYEILRSRYRGKRGEIDLIVSDGHVIVFVEVKKSKTHSRAIQRVSVAQRERIWLTASEFLGTQPLGQLTETRFDVALVDQHGRLKVIENAFGHD